MSWTGQTESLCLNVLLKLAKLCDDSLLYKCMHDGTQTSYDSFHHLIWKRCPKSVFVGRKRLYVAIDAAIVCNEGETGRVPIFSIPGLSVCTFMKLGFVEIDRNESQTLKSKLLKLASPQEKKKQVTQAATWEGYDSY